jgi:uncharacterized protein (DUF885 family)
LHRIAEQYWNFIREENPLAALAAGQPVTGDLLRQAPEDAERRAQRAAGFLADLEPVVADDLAAQDRATLLLMREELSLLREAVDVDAHLRPSVFPMGPEFSLMYAANMTTLLSLDDAERWLDNLATVPRSMASVQESMRAGLECGITLPRLSLERAAGNTEGLLGAIESNPFHGPFTRAVGRVPGMSQLASRSERLLNEQVLPSLRAYQQFLRGEMLENARDTVACTDSPKGRAYYEHLIRQYATVTDSPESIHKLGLSEVERINGEMAETATEAGFPSDVAGFQQSLRDDPAQFAPSGEALREQIEVLSKRIEARLPAFFGRLPRITYGVQSIPEAIASKMPPAYAQPNPADNSSPGVHWITSVPTMCPKYMHLPLALHEAWPGHLMHLALIQEQEHLPAFRRYGALGYSACLEGWALYCERLGEELGLYDTPQKRYGRLEMEMWRAVRLVVDTGLHINGWTRQQAIDYAVSHMAMPRATLEAEVDRYISMPAQALAYQLGNLKFRDLRSRAERRLGDKFRIRDFHDALMGAGPVSLPILDALIEDWITNRATRQ